MTPIKNHSEYSESDPADRFGSIRAVIRRIFGDAEHPLSWAIPLFTFSGIRVRLHILFLVYAIAQVLWSISYGSSGPVYLSIAMALLFVVVLAHEFGHCFACRHMGGDADEIIMWPLGGLAMCHPNDHWRDHLVTTLGGPAVNFALLPLTSAALWAAGKPDLILFDPRLSSAILFELGTWPMVALWMLHAINLLVLVFNVIVPMYPLDGGRVLQALLWRSRGRRASMEAATVIGLVTAGLLGVFALVTNMTLLLGIAIFSALVCWSERQRLSSVDLIGGGPGSFSVEPDDLDEERVANLAQRRAEREAAERAELDSILKKIADSGIESLSMREKRILRKATKKQQRRES
jgi:stage IV sporulation protein FB